jgi:elongation factor G
MLPFEWKKFKLNIIDTPGYADFVVEVKSGVRVADEAIIIVCAASGVEVGTEQAWRYTEERGLPRFIFINKIDRENADFFKVVGEVQARLGRKCLPIQMPIGAQQDFQGVIDLIKMKAYSGPKWEEGDIPQPLRARAEELHEKLVEGVAESDDDLTAKYLEGEKFSQEVIAKGLRAATLRHQIVPIMVGSTLKNIGVAPVLDAICEYLPSPKDVGAITALNPDTKAEETVAPEATGPLLALIFKSSADPYVGKLTYLRVYSGTINSDSAVWNSTKGKPERIGQLYVLRGKAQEAAPHLVAGDIGAVAKLSETVTCDTFCNKEHPLVLPPIQFPEPIFSVAVHPKTKADVDKLGAALSRLVEEDPSLQVRRDPSTYETILSGMGETQLEVAAEKMLRKFGVDVKLEMPKIPYRESITVATKSEYKHKKQTGGHGQYGHVFLELEPLPKGSGYEFADRVVGGSVPRNYIPAVEKGIVESLGEGMLAKYPVVDVRVTLYDGSSHPVDSSEMAFKIAASHAFRKGLAQAQPVLLEPIMNLKIRVPDSYTGDVIGDLNSKRAKVLGMNPEDGYNTIEAQAPMAEVQRYAIDLRSMTQGRGSFRMEFSHYEQVPPHITQKIVAERSKEAVKA